MYDICWINNYVQLVKNVLQTVLHKLYTVQNVQFFQGSLLTFSMDKKECNISDVLYRR